MDNINNNLINKQKEVIIEISSPEVENYLLGARKVISTINPAVFFENSLKVLNNGLDLYGNLGALVFNTKIVEDAKTLRTPVQGVQQIHFVVTGKAAYHPQNLINSKESRFKFIKTLFTATSLFRSSLTYTQQAANYLYDKADFTPLVEAANSGFKFVKCASKVAAFEMSYRNWANLPPDASTEALSEARLRLCSAAINLTSEVAKIAYLFSGHDMPNKLQHLLNAAAICASLADIKLLEIDLNRSFT